MASAQRERRPAQPAQPHEARRAALAADHRIAAPSQHERLRAQQHHRQHEQRQGGGGGQLGLGRVLEQAPDLGGHGVEAGRQRQDRRRAEQRHRLQEGHQRAGGQRRQRQRDRHPPRRAPGAAAQHGGGVLEVAGDAVERVGDQHEHVREGVAGDDEDQAGECVDVEQHHVRAGAGGRAIELVEEAAVGRGQQLPGDGAEERRRHERGHHQHADGAAEGNVAARHDPAHGRGDEAADEADRGGDDERGRERLEEHRIGEERDEIGQRDVARAVGEGEHDQPRDRQHDQQAQRRRKQRHDNAGQVEAGADGGRGRCWQSLDGHSADSLLAKRHPRRSATDLQTPTRPPARKGDGSARSARLTLQNTIDVPGVGVVRQGGDVGGHVGFGDPAVEGQALAFAQRHVEAVGPERG